MPRPTSHSQYPAKWAKGFRRELQTAIGRGLQVEFALPQEMVAELASLLGRMDKRPRGDEYVVLTSPSNCAWPAADRPSARLLLTKDCAGAQPNLEAVIGVAKNGAL
jgi:hypothetical protein